MNSHNALGFGDFCRRRFGDFRPELVLISNQERGGTNKVQMWMQKDLDNFILRAPVPAPASGLVTFGGW